MSELNFTVDKSKCIHCGLCIKDCITNIINFDYEKNPYIKSEHENRCIKCQHCMAVCPVGAISILGKNPDNSLKNDTNIDVDNLISLMKSRRSYRHYKNENLDKETLNKLKDVLKFVPTGCNSHKLHFSIIEDLEVMNKFRNSTNNKLKNILLKTGNNPIAKKFESFRQQIIDGKDLIYRDAPHLIVVSAPITSPCPQQDGIIALSYFELLAQSLGVGTCWCGFSHMCLRYFPDLCEFLEIPDGYKPIYSMLFGPTDIKYARCPQPEEVEISYPKGNKNVDNIGIIKKIKRHIWNNIR